MILKQISQCIFLLSIGLTLVLSLTRKNNIKLAKSSKLLQTESSKSFIDGEVSDRTGNIRVPNLESNPFKEYHCRNLTPGYYADVSTNCQGYYYCHEDHRQDDFICVPGTVFNQDSLVCEWWWHPPFPCQPKNGIINQDLKNRQEKHISKHVYSQKSNKSDNGTFRSKKFSKNSQDENMQHLQSRQYISIALPPKDKNQNRIINNNYEKNREFNSWDNKNYFDITEKQSFYEEDINYQNEAKRSNVIDSDKSDQFMEGTDDKGSYYEDYYLESESTPLDTSYNQNSLMDSNWWNEDSSMISHDDRQYYKKYPSLATDDEAYQSMEMPLDYELPLRPHFNQVTTVGYDDRNTNSNGFSDLLHSMRSGQSVQKNPTFSNIFKKRVVALKNNQNQHKLFKSRQNNPSTTSQSINTKLKLFSSQEEQLLRQQLGNEQFELIIKELIYEANEKNKVKHSAVSGLPNSVSAVRGHGLWSDSNIKRKDTKIPPASRNLIKQLKSNQHIQNRLIRLPLNNQYNIKSSNNVQNSDSWRLQQRQDTEDYSDGVEKLAQAAEALDQSLHIIGDDCYKFTLQGDLEFVGKANRCTHARSQHDLSTVKKYPWGNGRHSINDEQSQHNLNSFGSKFRHQNLKKKSGIANSLWHKIKRVIHNWFY